MEDMREAVMGWQNYVSERAREMGEREKEHVVIFGRRINSGVGFG